MSDVRDEVSHKSMSLGPGSNVIVSCGLITYHQTPEYRFTA